MGTIKIEGIEIYPAQTEGSPDVYSESPFRLAKAKWVSDDEASICIACNQKFTQLRRKHHCRMCGRVLCSKCCKEKVPLPQLSLHDPERVCDICLPVTELVTKARSGSTAFQIEASTGLLENVCDPKGLRKVVELGGLQTLIYLSRVNAQPVKRACASGIHSMSTHQPLQHLLADAGAIKAICSILSTADESQETLIIDAISALMIFVKSPHLKTKAISDGALQPVLKLCGMQASEAIALLAVRTLNLITEHAGNHAAIIENDRNALPHLLSLTTSSDEQMQEITLKTLGGLSMGTDWHRHRIVQEDFSSGRCLARVLRSRPKNKQVLCNAACLVANLATGEQDQGSLSECVDSLCTLLSEFRSQKELLKHVARALANFAKYRHNAFRLVERLPVIITICLKSNAEDVAQQGVRIVLHLLQHSPDSTINCLLTDGATDLLKFISKSPGMVDAMQSTLLMRAAEREAPS
ncbi:uncharacterized protein LOC121431903 [Lytechinus variegatus]|uniref:uncharacterized protein LOC121431903 n=1 Tax=Lytechinus variegatus TaxID=7654 RepID=UPI001BB0EE19|nr:uncharacterized protein LOC121431903 [Lytechinus variegatus]